MTVKEYKAAVIEIIKRGAVADAAWLLQQINLIETMHKAKKRNKT